MPLRDGDGYNFGGEWTVTLGYGGPTLIVGSGVGTEAFGDNERRAKLIAAAPWLKLALQELARCCDTSQNATVQELRDAREAALAVLAEAGGEG